MRSIGRAMSSIIEVSTLESRCSPISSAWLARSILTRSSGETCETAALPHSKHTNPPSGTSHGTWGKQSAPALTGPDHPY